MNLDGNSLLAGFAVSSVGLGFFMYGKKQSRWPQMLFGVVCMVYPYFIGSPLLTFGICGLLLALMYLALRLGW
jgi:predicted cobalt transporter CbtA